MRWSASSPVFNNRLRFTSDLRWIGVPHTPTPPEPVFPFADTKRKFPAIAFQGIATDGVHILATNNTVCRKYDMAGNDLGDASHGLSGWKYEDFCIVGGVAYVTITNHSRTPRAGKIQMLDVASMTQIGDIVDLDEPIWPAAMAYRDGLFWLSVTESDTIYVYDETFTLQTTYKFEVVGKQSTVYPGYSGLEWIGPYLFGNKHGGAGRGIDVVRYDSHSDSLIPVAAFSAASSGTTQGMTYDPINNRVYWAARGHGNEVWESVVNEQWFS